jgi:hypothetical protein
MAEHALSDLADRIRDALLFDVRVERVDVNLVGGTVDVSVCSSFSTSVWVDSNAWLT